MLIGCCYLPLENVRKMMVVEEEEEKEESYGGIGGIRGNNRRGGI